MIKKDYSLVVRTMGKGWSYKVDHFVRIDPIVNGRQVFIDVIKWDGNVAGVMNEIYKQCGFMENHLYNNVKQELFHLKHQLVEDPKPCRLTAVMREMPKIKNVIFNDPATIVFWTDETKTVVKCQDDDIFDPEKGLAMAISKRALGNQGNYCNEFKKWLPEEIKEKTVYLDAKELARRINAAARKLRMSNKEEKNARSNTTVHE